MLVCGSIEEPARAAPPASPGSGEAYIVADDASGAWEGKSGCVAAWTSGGWRFVSPLDGMTLYERGSGTWATFRRGAWEIGLIAGTSLNILGQQVVGPRAAAIASPTGGAMIDGEARQAITAILSTLRQHGLIEA